MSEGFVVGEMLRDRVGNVVGWRSVAANAAWEQLAGVAAKGARNGNGALIPGLSGDWLEGLAGVARSGMPVTFASDVATFDRWYEARVFRLEAGRFAALCLDVTARRSAEAEARCLYDLAGQSGDFIAVTRQDGRIRYLNPAGQRMAGLADAEAARRMTLLELVGPEDRQIIASLGLPRVLQTGHWGGELHIRRIGTQDLVPVHFTLFRLRDAGGAMNGFGCVTRDITDRRLAEARRAALLEVGDRLRDIRDPAEMAFVAAEIIGGALGASRAGYGTIEAAGDTLSIARDWTAPGVESLAGRFRFDEYGSFVEELRQGRTLVVCDAQADLRTAASAERWQAAGVRAVVNHPIFEHGEFVALFFVQQREPRTWSQQELAFVRNVADRTRDAVERRRAEDRLRGMAASLEQEVAARTADRNRIWQLSNDILLVAEFDATMLAVNPAWTAHLAWTEAELVGRSLFDLVHEDDLEASRNAMRRLAAGVTLRRFDNRMRHKEGGFRWITWTAAAGEGRIHAAGRDFTEERSRAAELELSEGRLRSVFETTYQLQGLLSVDGLLLDANPTALAAIEAGLDDVLGAEFWRTPWFSATPGMPELVQSAIAKVAAGETFRQELTVDLPTGRRAFDFAMRPVTNEAGEVIAIVPEAMDLTDRRATEAQLRQAQKMEAVGQLTGGLAHDFNNLLAGIIGGLAMLKSRLAQGRADEVGRYIHAVESSANRAASLTQRLLAFARQQTLDPHTVRANELISDMQELIRRSVGPQVRLQTRLADGLWPTRCDAHQLESALLNLCINARDAMPNGGILLLETSNTVIDAPAAALRDMEPGEYVSISVSDTGTGMTQDVVARAFDPFFTTKPIGQGTGLGLSMVYGFTKQSRGQVRIHSQPGEGTTVRLHLPRQQEEAPVMQPTSDIPTPTKLAGGANILVVDDEPFVAMLITDVVQDLGCTWIDAADGASAMQAVRSDQKIDLMITDIGLPGGMNGRQLADSAREVRPALKVLFVTGYAQGGVLGDGALADGMQVITKPFAIEALEEKIRDMLGG